MVNIFYMEVVNMLKRNEFEATETFAYHAERDLEKSIIDSFFNKSIDEIDFDFSETEEICNANQIDGDDIQKFMSIYRKNCKKFSDILSKNLIDTLMMCGFKSKKSAGFSKVECAECLVETVNQMLEVTKSDRTKLNNLADKRFDKYFSKLTKSIVKQTWLSGTTKYVNRIDIFKICFALGLKSKYDKKYIEDEPCYENLFNKVFNQRYCLKQPDEMCFSYCLKVGKSYGDALGLYDKYLELTKKQSNESNDNSKTGNDTITMFENLSEIKNDDDFMNYLLSNFHDDLNNKTSINKYLIDKIMEIEEFDDEVKQRFEYDFLNIAYGITKISDVGFSIGLNSINAPYFKSESPNKPYFAECFMPVLYNKPKLNMDKQLKDTINIIDEIIKVLDKITKKTDNYSEFLKDDIITILIKNMNMKKRGEKTEINESDVRNIIGKINNFLQDKNIDCTEIFQTNFNIIITEPSDILESCISNLSDLRDDLLLIRQIFVPMKINKYKHKSNQNNKADEFVSHTISQVYIGYTENKTMNTDYYTNMRKLMIVLNFFWYYILQSDNKTHSVSEMSKDFVAIINKNLKQYYFNCLYPYNNFDLFFILCSKTQNPIFTYYYILQYYAQKLEVVPTEEDYIRPDSNL